RQQPVRIQPFLEEVDSPGELHVRVDRVEILRITVGPMKFDMRRIPDLRVEIIELAIGWPAAQHDLDPPLHARGEVAKYRQRPAASQCTEPAYAPWHARMRRT